MKLLCALILIILYCIPKVHSQSIIRSTVGSSGSSQTVFFNNKPYFVSQSIGQSGVIGTSGLNGYTIRQGFQQPPHSFVISQPYPESDLKAAIYPNPFQQSIHIFFKEEIENDISVIMYNMSGQIILKETYGATQMIILPLANTACGKYILNVIADNKYIITSLIKQ